MAVQATSGSGFLNLPIPIKRLNATFIDPTSIWNSYEEALNYAQTDPTAVIGQVLTVYDSTKSTNAVLVYVIDNDSTLKLVGNDASATVVDTLPSTADTSYTTGCLVYVNSNNRMYYLRSVSTTTEDEEGNSTTTTTRSWVPLLEEADLEGSGTGDMLISIYDTDGDGSVDYADVAKRTTGSLYFADSDGNVKKTFTGALNVTISAEDIGALTEVPVATESTIGGIKSSTTQDSVSVNGDGTLSLNNISASKVQGTVTSATTATKVGNKLKITSTDGTSVTYDGSATVEITADSLGALTEVSPATTTTIGGVIVGDGLSIDAEGYLTADVNSMTVATTTTTGVVKIGKGLSITTDGTLSADEYDLPVASMTTLGGVMIDGSTIIVNSSTDVISVGTIDGSQVSGTVESASTAEVASKYYTGSGTASIADALDKKLNTSDLESTIKENLVGVANGIAPLDANKLISSEYLPSYVDDVIEGSYISETEFQVSGVTITLEAGKIYIDDETNTQYRYTGSKLVNIIDPLDYATTEDAQAMTSETLVMTPARTSEAIQASYIDVSKLFVSDGETLILKCGNSSF